MTLRCYHTQASFLLIIRYRPGDDTGLHFKDRRGKVPTLWLILWRATEAHRSTQHRRPACGARTYLSLQTSTLLGVKNLKAICGGCVLTCPGWAVWRGRPAEEEARTPHSRPTKRFSAAWLHGSEEPPPPGLQLHWLTPGKSNHHQLAGWCDRLHGSSRYRLI